MAADRIQYDFDRFLRYDELRAWLEQLAAEHPDLVTVETYGASFEGRDLLLATVTDSATGAHDTKPAHWIDASIHAVELTATVAACNVLQHLVDRFVAGDELVDARRCAAGRSTSCRASIRTERSGRWPTGRAGDGRAFAPGRTPTRTGGPASPFRTSTATAASSRCASPILTAPGRPTPTSPDCSSRFRPTAACPPAHRRYRSQWEGLIEHYDGFTVPTPAPPEGLDMNRNFPAGWGTNVRGSGDHPLSEPEIDALVRAIVARPNICGYNAFHTSGGVLLRPSSMVADATLPPRDVWVYKQLAERGTALTGYTSHSVFEDFTFDTTDTMSGAADDWAYEHLGVYAWTTEFWDIVHAATGTKQSTHFWYVGPTTDEALAVLRWLDRQQRRT